MQQHESEPAPPKRTIRSLISGALVATGLLLLKLKGLLFLLVAKFKIFAVNPFEGFGVSQFLMAGGSMAVTIVAYAVKMGKAFAVGFVLLTVIHEIGHAIAIRAKGLRAGAMVFIPFVGGAVTLRDQPHSAYDDAQIGLAGPVAGTIASLACLYIYHLTGRPLYLAVSFAGFLLNLFNLLPIGPLDGGRVSAAISKWIWLLGGLILVWIMIAWRSPLLLLVLVLSLFQIHRAIRLEQETDSYRPTLSQRLSIGASYFSLVGFLGWISALTHTELQSLMK